MKQSDVTHTTGVHIHLAADCAETALVPAAHRHPERATADRGFKTCGQIIIYSRTLPGALAVARKRSAGPMLGPWAQRILAAMPAVDQTVFLLRAGLIGDQVVTSRSTIARTALT